MAMVAIHLAREKQVCDPQARSLTIGESPGSGGHPPGWGGTRRWGAGGLQEGEHLGAQGGLGGEVGGRRGQFRPQCVQLLSLVQ